MVVWEGHSARRLGPTADVLADARSTSRWSAVTRPKLRPADLRLKVTETVKRRLVSAVDSAVTTRPNMEASSTETKSESSRDSVWAAEE